MNEEIKYYMIKDNQGKRDYIKVIEKDRYNRKIIKEEYNIKKCEMYISETILPKNTLDDSYYFEVMPYDKYIRCKIGQAIEDVRKTIEHLKISIEFMNNYIEMQCIKDKFSKCSTNYDISCLINRRN